MKRLSILVFALALLLSACQVAVGETAAPAVPTLSPLEIQATAQAMAQELAKQQAAIAVQQTLMAMPTATPQPTATLQPAQTQQLGLVAPTFPPIGESAPVGAPVANGASPIGSVSTCNSFTFNPNTVDVTIPDGTKLAPGTSFVKKWLIYNAGTCTWKPGYKLVFVIGNQMGAPDYVTLTSSVQPNEYATISVPMVVDSNNLGANLVGNWRLQDADGNLFGTFLTVSVVVAAPTATPTNTPVATNTPAPTATPTNTPAPTATATP